MSRIYVTFLLLLICMIFSACSSELYKSRKVILQEQPNTLLFTRRVLLNISSKACIDECASSPGCSYVNYQRRFHLCSVIHYSDTTTSLPVAREAGYIYAKKADLPSPNTLCDGCSDIDRCDESVAPVDCVASDCGMPSVPANSSISGNMFNIGRRIKFTCAENTIMSTATTNTAVCQQDGQWSETNFDCTPAISVHTITGGQLFGGDPGNPNLIRFNDSSVWNDGRITAIQMLCGQYLLAFKVQFNGVWTAQRGFWNPACSTNQTWTPAHEFGEDEWIQHAVVTGSRWHSVTFTTNKRQLETCGVPVTSPRFQEGGRLQYVSGIFGCYFDELQFYWSNYRDFN